MELVVVMGLMALFFFVAAPRFMPRMFESRLETSARRLATATRYLHTQTALTRSEATLHIDVTSNEYWVTKPAEENDEELEQDELEMFGSDPEDFHFEFEDDTSFDSDGTVLGIEFDLDKLIEGDEPEEEEMTTVFIARTTLPEGVRFAGLLMPNAEQSDDTTDFEIQYGLFGLKERAIIVLADDRGKKLSVRLDPVLGESTVETPDGRVLDALGIKQDGDRAGWQEF